MIPIKDQINIIVEESTKQLQNKTSNGEIWWFITEIIQIIVFVMGAIMLLWLYAPFSLITKFIITTLSGIIIYDVFKNFVYVRWILYKESKGEE